MLDTISSLTYSFAQNDVAGQTALVMLPGAGMRAQEYQEYGLVSELHECCERVDAVMVDVAVSRYASLAFAQKMSSEVIEPLREHGYQRIWLAGISLGAYGALRLLQEGVQGIEGMLLLSPFLATRGTVARIIGAGGLNQWSPLPEERTSEDESLLWWLKNHLMPDTLPTKIYLGWGALDRYADASILLAARLPQDKIYPISGDHDWPTWISLWKKILDAAPFGASLGSGTGNLQ